MSQHVTIINIPAYDTHNRGLVVKFKLRIFPNHKFQIITNGKVAAALCNNFKRIIEIMASLKKSWECLESTAYLLECCNDKYFAKDSKSSSMALSIALINVYRVIEGKSQVPGLSGTGVLRIDGSFDCAQFEEKKYLAAKKKIKSLNKFITPQECDHLFELEKIIDQYQ